MTVERRDEEEEEEEEDEWGRRGDAGERVSAREDDYALRQMPAAQPMAPPNVYAQSLQSAQPVTNGYGSIEDHTISTSSNSHEPKVTTPTTSLPTNNAPQPAAAVVPPAPPPPPPAAGGPPPPPPPPPPMAKGKAPPPGSL